MPKPVAPSQPVSPLLDPLAAEPTSGGFLNEPAPIYHPPNRSNMRTPTATGKGALQPFLSRWCIGLGTCVALLLVLAIAGLFSQGVAFGFIIICFIITLGCLIVGQIWMAVELGKTNVALGIAALFVSIVGLVFAIKGRGNGQRAAVIYVSSLLPIILGAIFAPIYQSKFTSEGRNRARTAKLSNDLPKLTEMISNTEREIDDSAPLATATFKYTLIGGKQITAAQCDAILSPFKHYVKGSFQIDSENRTASFEYRGTERLASQYKLLLYNRTQVGFH
ncbi:MAG: hypothetical protein R3C53_20815 [Pirellulaceae bacterium]